MLVGMDLTLIPLILCPAAVIGLGGVIIYQIILQEQRKAHARVADLLKVAQRGDEAIPDLVLLLTDPSLIVRIAAAEALGGIGAVSSLLAALTSPPAQDRAAERFHKAVVGALADIGQKAIPDLLDALRHDDWRVRRAAIDALRRIGADPVPTLLGALQDSNPDVRTHAAWTLGQLRDKRAIPGLTNALLDQAVRGWAISALSKVGSDPLPGLLQLFYQSEAEVRRAIVEALGDLGDHRAIPYLQAAATDDEAPSVRQAAVDALTLIERAAPTTAVYGILRRDEDTPPWVR
jgi:HEAT repeat protein